MKYITRVGDREYIIEILDNQQIAIDGEICDVDFDLVSGQPVFSLLIDKQSYEAYVYEDEQGWEVLLRGNLYQVDVIDEREHRLRSSFGSRPIQSGEFYLKAPMPGLVIDVPVSDGQRVSEGDVLVVLESMKMQNELKSPREGKVSRLRVETGDSVERRQTLLSVV